jgi:hypothetical protein
MLRHVVIFTFVPGTPDATVDEIAGRLRALEQEVGEVSSVTCERDLGISDRSADLVLITELADADAWRAYQSHPAHQAVLELILPVLSSRAAVQYEMPPAVTRAG